MSMLVWDVRGHQELCIYLWSMQRIWTKPDERDPHESLDTESTVAACCSWSFWTCLGTPILTSDYFSDFFELDDLRSTTSTSVIKKLKTHFSRHGIPEQLVTDNGPQFVSRDFLKFTKEWDFEHLTNSAHHNQANGKAESAVEEAKKIIMKCKKAGSDMLLTLMDHRNTPPASV